MGDSLRLLHLSDLHLGSPAGRSQWAKRESDLFSALNTQAGRHGSPDLIFLTGDLAWSGSDENYRAVDAFWKRLLQAVGGNPCVVPVPGNHDVAWRAKADPWIRVLRDIAANPGYLEAEALKTRDAKAIAEVSAPFAAYAAWTERTVFPHWRSFNAQIRPGLLPGDFILSLPLRDWRLGLVGFNTAWVSTFDERLLADKRGFKDRICVYPEQITTIENWHGILQQHHQNFLLAHHPPSWWCEAQRDEFDRQLFDPRQFVGLFAGHLHGSRARDESGESGLSRLYFQAGSVHGVEGYASGHESSAPLEYSWFTLEKSGPSAGKFTESRFRGDYLPDHTFEVQSSTALPAKTVTLHTPPPTAATRIVILGIESEFAETFKVIQDHFGGQNSLGMIECVDSESSHSLGAVTSAHLVIFLFGVQIGSGRLAELQGKAKECCPLIIRAADTTDLDDDSAARHRLLRKSLRGSPTFEKFSDLPHLVRQLLSDWTEKHSPKPAAHRSSLHGFERAYLEAKIQFWSSGGNNPFLRTSGGGHLGHASVYVPLRIEATGQFFEDKNGNLIVTDLEKRPAHPGSAKADRRSPDSEAKKAPKAGSVLSTQSVHRFVVRGHPGSGKTVLLQHFAHVLASEHLGSPVRDHELDLRALTEGPPLLPIPILLQAQALASAIDRKNATKDPALACLVEAVRQTFFDHVGDSAPTDAAILEALRQGRYLVLLDALDEIREPHLRQPVLDLLESLHHLRFPRIVLATRPTAHTGTLRFPPSFTSLELAELDQPTRVALIRRYAEARGFDSAWGERCDAAVREGEARLDASILTRNPLQLTAALLIYADQGKLPDSPEELYRKLVDHLCERRPNADWDPNRRRRFLRRLFLAAQRHGGREIPLDLACGIAQEEGIIGLTEQGAALSDVGDATGLLRFVTRSDAKGTRTLTVLEPFHRSFQEFLAAEQLSHFDASEIFRTISTAPENRTAAPLLDPNWAHTLRFLIGCIAFSRPKPATELVQHLLASLEQKSITGEPLARALATLGAGLADYTRDLRTETQFLQDYAERMYQLFRSSGPSWSVEVRERFLESLGRLNDPRLDPTRESPWVAIPAGRYLLGGDQRAYQSLPECRITLASFRIAWHLVTVQDFAAFVDAGGYSDPDASWWLGADPAGDVATWLREESIRGPAEWERQKYRRTHPVVGVSAFEADAYCRWASLHARDRWALVDSEFLDLPTADESEAAAGGPSGLIYPWGSEEPSRHNEFAAFVGDGRSRLAPVGCFPAGEPSVPIPTDARRRLADLSGNAWEWTRSAWSETRDEQQSAQLAPSGRAPRVIRGGSWSLVPGVLRCAARSRGHPGDRGSILGFRVVVRGSPEHAP